MATDKAAGTDNLLRNILLELQSLNRNLERRPSGAVNSLDPPIEGPEGALTLPENPVPTGNHSSQSQQDAKSINAPTQEAAGEQIPPTTDENEERPSLWTKDVLPFKYVQEGDILPLFETYYCAYHWLLSPHDWLNEDDYAKPSTEVINRWCRLYSKWGVPSDGRLQLSFETKELMRMHRADPERALQHLKKLDVLENSLGRNGCSFVIHDHIEDKEVGQLGHVDVFTGRPEILFKPKTIPQAIPRIQNIHPWNRSIIITGVCATLPAGTTILDAYPWFGREGLRRTWPVLIAHCKCLAKSGSPMPHPKHLRVVHFHVRYFETDNRGSTKRWQGRIWKSGRLHSDAKNHWSEWLRTYGGFDLLRRCSFSMASIYTIEPSGIKKFKYSYWTTLVLTSADSWNYSGLTGGEDSLIVVDMLRGRMDQGLGVAMRCINGLHRCLAQLINGDDPLLDPGQHDTLLSDDDSFSRSKMYFWCLNLLRELARNMDEFVSELEDFPSRFLSKHIAVNGAPSMEKLEQRCQYWIERFKSKKGELLELREEAKALRDGLFSASSVMESRASTRLGENVRLLTYVSIVFLPLSFCMSVWSINDQLFSIRSLIITATIVAISTYILVLNVNNVGKALTILKQPRSWKALLNVRFNNLKVLFEKHLKILRKNLKVKFRETTTLVVDVVFSTISQGIFCFIMLIIKRWPKKTTLKFDRIWTWMKFWKRSQRGDGGIAV